MRKSKTQKGITLIALIITIIVLLILAVVAIGAVQNDGIINYAKNAREQYEAAQKNEETILNNYLEILNENTGSSTITVWTQNGTTVTNGTVTLAVGDTVDYVSGVTIEVEVEGYDGIEFVAKPYEEIGEWKILGAENGEILLMSTQNVLYDTMPYGGLYLEGADGYLNGVSQLNTICEPYGNGEHASKTTKARSVKVEDVNRVTGYNPRNVGVYDPMQTGEGTIYGQGTIEEYGNEVTYTLEEDEEYGTTLIGTGTNGLSVFEEWAGFEMPDGTTPLTADNSIKVRNSHYFYYSTTLTNNSTGDTVGLSTDSEAYKMLFGKEENFPLAYYWLGSSYVYANEFGATFGMYNVSISGGCVGSHSFWQSRFGKGDFGDYGVRAVVSLESNVELEEDGTNSWKIVANS